MSIIDDLANELAAEVMAAQAELGDDVFYEKVSKVLGAASPTIQEAFLTSMRMRIAAQRGRTFLEAALKAKREEEVSATPATVAKPKITAAAKAKMLSDALDFDLPPVIPGDK